MEVQNVVKKYIRHPETNSRILDITGQRFGKLVAVKLIPQKKENGGYRWLFICDCGTFKSIRYTNVKRKDRATKSCGCLQKEYVKSLKGEKSHTYKGTKYIPKGYYSRCKKGAEIRKLKFTITIEDMENLLVEQDFKCRLSGIPIKLGVNKIYTASLDRIDSSKGYIKGNIQWIHKDINRMKMDLPENKFIEYCNLVSLRCG